MLASLFWSKAIRSASFSRDSRNRSTCSWIQRSWPSSHSAVGMCSTSGDCSAVSTFRTQTLFDLDLGRDGGGFGRVKTAIENLLEIGVDAKDLLGLSDGTLLSREGLAKMHDWNELEHLEGWVDSLEKHAVFFSSPLDIDLAMIAAFPDAYKKIIPKGGGPRMTVDKAAEAVLGDGGLSCYDGPRKPFRDLLPGYRYHFLTHSKPATHLRALVGIDDATLKATMPRTLRAVLKHVKKHLRRD